MGTGLEECEKWLREFLDLICKNRPNGCNIGGDLFSCLEGEKRVHQTEVVGPWKKWKLSGDASQLPHLLYPALILKKVR